MGVTGILQARLITSVIIYLALLPMLIKYMSISLSLHKLKEMLSFGIPLIVTGLGSWILILADRYILNIFCSLSEVGLYALGYKFGMIINSLIASPLQLAWLPFIFRIKDHEDADSIYAITLNYFALIIVFFALALSVMIKPILWLVVTPTFYDAYQVVPFIAFSYVLYGCYLITAVPFYLKEKTKFLVLLVVISAVLNLTLNYVLIPIYGMIGAAITTLISYSVLLLNTIILGRRYYPIPFKFLQLLKLFVSALVIYIGSSYINLDSVILVWVLRLMTLACFPVLLLLLKFFNNTDIEAVKAIIKYASVRIKPS
jgi:O-antigen/teichoic acid export membrane protein